MMDRYTAFPCRSDDGAHDRLLGFAREAAAALVDGFAPPANVLSQREASVPYDHDERRTRFGDEAHGFEVSHRLDYVEAGAVTLSADTVTIDVYGLPEGVELRAESVRPPNHPRYLRTVRASVSGPADRTARVADAFRAAFPGDPLSSEELDATLSLASSYLREPMWTEALTYARAVLGARPEDHRAMLVIGIALAATGELDEAERVLEALTRGDGTSVDALYNLGRIRLDRGRVEQALGCFDAAVAADPENHPCHFMRGSCLEVLGRLEDAQEAYERAIATSANPGGAWGFRGMDVTVEARAALARLGRREP
jgi:tetratricopeptide (TPR) repeat protein